jgi:hypothetical protein
MQRIIETSKITEMYAVADVTIEAAALRSRYRGVVVEVTNGVSFEGTLVYFPGVSLTQLMEDTDVDPIASIYCDSLAASLPIQNRGVRHDAGMPS